MECSNPDTLWLIKDLTTAIQNLGEVNPWNVSSLLTEPSHRVRQGTLKFKTLLESFPAKAAGSDEPSPALQRACDQVRHDTLVIDLYTGTIASPDGSAAAIFVGVPPGTNRVELYKTIQDLIAGFKGRAEAIHVIGAPVAEALLGTHILEDLGVPSRFLGHRMGRGEQSSTWHVPRSLYELRLLVSQHIGLVPIAIVIMAFVFLLSFRSLVATVLPLTEVGACLLFVFGLMGWLAVPVYLTIAVLPVILTAMGIADEIHIFDRYAEQLRRHLRDKHLEALTVTMDEMWVPVTKTSVTTAVGFLSFALSPIAPVRAFGVFTAVGIIFCMLWSLTVIPALLAMIGPKRLMTRRSHSPTRERTGRVPLFARLGRLVTRHRFAVLGLAILVAVAAPFGARQIVVQDSWIDGFAADSEFYKATQLFNDKFLGTHILLVRVDAGCEVITGELKADTIGDSRFTIPAENIGDPRRLIGRRVFLRLKDPGRSASRLPKGRRSLTEWRSRVDTAVREGDQVTITTPRRSGFPKRALRASDNDLIVFEIASRPLTFPEGIGQIEALEKFIEEQSDCAVGGVIGAPDYIATTNFMSSGLQAARQVVPDNSDRIEWLWAQYRRIRGAERMRQAVDADFAQSLVTIFLNNANFVDTQHLMDRIRDYEREHLTPRGISLEFAGDVAVSQTLIQAIVRTQTWSLVVSLVGIFALTAVLGRSLAWGFYCVLPCALAVLVNFAVMGWTSMPLGVATSMFAGMTLGIGVDFAIHLMERFRLARSRGMSTEDAVADAVTATGPAVFIDALAVALGFGVLALSQVPANARLGGLVVLSIAGCLAVTLVLLPALLRIYEPRTAWRADSEGVRNTFGGAVRSREM